MKQNPIYLTNGDEISNIMSIRGRSLFMEGGVPFKEWVKSKHVEQHGSELVRDERKGAISISRCLFSLNSKHFNKRLAMMSATLT